MPPPPTATRVSGLLAKNKKHGWTLAETLITLTIIGVIAALTLPNLTQKWKKQERISQLQVAYSILQNATKLAVAEHGEPSTWDFQRRNDNGSLLPSESAQAYAEKYFIPYIKTKDKSVPKEELKDSHGYEIHYLNGNVENLWLYTQYAYSVLLDNGMLVHITTNSTTNACFGVDVNGFQGPNMYANDIFRFCYNFEKNALSPSGANSTTNNCSINYAGLYAYKGMSCANYIINNGWQIPDDYPIRKF